jgi:hypothetical protein
MTMGNAFGDAAMVISDNTTLSSDSLESGTGSSNSLRSANESLRTDNELLLIVTLFGAHSANSAFAVSAPTGATS